MTIFSGHGVRTALGNVRARVRRRRRKLLRRLKKGAGALRKRARRAAKRTAGRWRKPMKRMARRLRKPIKRGRRTSRRALRILRRRRRGPRETYDGLIAGLRHRRWNSASCTVPVEEDMRAAVRWRGDRPRVALRCLNLHPVFLTYRSHPPLRYAPSPVAELDHWVNPWTGADLYQAGRRPSSRGPRPYVVEVEHWIRLCAGHRPENRELWDWDLALRRRDVVRQRFGREECRAIVTYSPGMTEHFKAFLAPELWPKLTHLYPAAPGGPGPRPTRGPFTILTIGNRFAEKGIPEALEVFRTLRERHGDDVRMLLACRDVPSGTRLPEGVTLIATHRMSEDAKSTAYRAADVLLLPVYWDLVNSFAEAPAFGIPTITTRIHHGDAFVRHGVTGYLLDPPVFAYSEGFGTRWRSRDAFVADIDARRQRGELRPLVEEATELVEGMISGTVDHRQMGRAARELHAERFSPEVRNARVMRLYADALSG